MKTKKTTSTVLAFVIAVAFGIIASFGSASAATESVNSTVTFTIDSAIDVTATTATFDFGTVDPITGTYTEVDAATINVKSNTNWALTAKANTANFTGGASDKPMSDLQVYDEDLTTWNALSNVSDVAVKAGAKTATSDVLADYKLTVDWDDATGAYSGVVVYTGTTS